MEIKNLPKIDTLIEDMYELFNPEKGHEVNEENLNTFCDGLKDILRNRLSERNKDANPPRFSSLGKTDRQIWYAANSPDTAAPLTPKTYLKFLYGDVVEQLILFLAKEAGHTVEREQEELEVDGVKGHIDAIIDGHVVDVKTASPFGYKKFHNGDLFTNDPFGYVQQLSGYSTVLTPEKPAYFLAFDKVGGDMCTLEVGQSIIKDYDPVRRIAHLKEIIELPEPPPRCFDPVPDGKSGNMKLGVNCSYCSQKDECWPDIRTFLYSGGPRFLTTVRKVPDVYEVPK